MDFENITMESSGIELDGVEVCAKMPVSIKAYRLNNTDSFKTGEASLKCV
jgi:hypothetical protein